MDVQAVINKITSARAPGWLLEALHNPHVWTTAGLTSLSLIIMLKKLWEKRIPKNTVLELDLGQLGTVLEVGLKGLCYDSHSGE